MNRWIPLLLVVLGALAWPLQKWLRTDGGCRDQIGFISCGVTEGLTCKRTDQVLTWVPASPTGLVWRCTCPHK